MFKHCGCYVLRLLFQILKVHFSIFSGRYGLWLDDNMYNGRTEKCSTFNSPALVPEKDFKIKTVECWSVAIV